MGNSTSSVLLTLAAISILFSSCLKLSGVTTISGNKNVVTKTISITDYEKIEISNNANLIYVQKESEEPFFQIEVDENIFELLEVKVKGNSLRIKPIDTNTHLKSTKFNIITNSKALSKISIAGSGKVVLSGMVKGESLDISIAGSGNVEAKQIDYQSTKVDIAGSGETTLGGKAIKSDFSIAGSGNIESTELEQETVKCDIAGSGNISLFATKELKNSIAGHGNIRYKGSPKIKNSIAGSGKIQNID